MATGEVGNDSGPLIPFSNSRCICRHTKGMHALGIEKCDNCNCSKFRLSTSLTAQEAWDLEQKELKGSMCVSPEAPTPSQNLDSDAVAGTDRGSATKLKDSGKRLEFDSGMVRDIEYDKPGFHFLIPKDIPFDAQMLTRVARHLREGAKKYTPRNWEKGNTNEEAERARESALRHMMQWIMGEDDEDHAAATIINILFAETMQYKANQTKETG